ncbi:uncharacterized protein Pyn_27484 [Prunus yedoensis var. nudiflora]|uniref:Transposase MuDR plant domain-containing protein n=1 Tax=Prunus yedoensis var. nudiflora TaxID=2094558 RepID=A0A314XVQ0_PRUYE|nr:uncharacterized protein Pyn_27484 [Prunus yedoensis var. nudiflora]
MANDLGYGDGYDVSFFGEEFGAGRLIQIISDMSLTSSQVGNESSDPEYCCSEDDDSSDPDFVDSDYAQSDEEIDLLKKDDKWFEGYVDHSCTDNDPNAEENDELDNGEESPTLTCPNSSSSLKFATAEIFRKAVRIYSINCGRELIFMSNDRNKIRVVCEEGCPFVIHASSVSGSTYLQSKFTKTMVTDHLEQLCTEQESWQLTL